MKGKIVGWNIYIEVMDEVTGHMQLIAWNISDGIARQLDAEYQELLEEEE